MLASLINNNQELVVGYEGGNGTVHLECANIPLIQGHSYALSFIGRSTIDQDITVQIYDSTLSNQSASETKRMNANIWKAHKTVFTAAATDTASRLRFILGATELYNFYVDRVRLIDLTVEQKEYRLMRIQGTMTPGSFVQTLTLREITAAETA